MPRIYTPLTPPKNFVAPDYRKYHDPEMLNNPLFGIGGNGCGFLNHGFHHFLEYISPLRNVNDFDALTSYPLMSNEGYSSTELDNAVKNYLENDLPALVWCGHCYEESWQIRGYEEFLMDLMLEPEKATHFLDHFTKNNQRTAKAAAIAGADGIILGDDVATQISLIVNAKIWRDIFKPRMASVIAAAKTIKPDMHVWYHSDGNISEIIDDLVEIGVTILNPVQPECVNPFEIRKRYGKSLAFDGCVGTQTTFPFGNAKDMRNVVNEYIDGLDGFNGGLMLSPTHVLEPEVPLENIISFFDAVDNSTIK